MPTNNNPSVTMEAKAEPHDSNQSEIQNDNTKTSHRPKNSTHFNTQICELISFFKSLPRNLKSLFTYAKDAFFTIVKSLPLPMLCIFFTWSISSLPIEGNPYSAINSFFNNPALIAIMTIPALMSPISKLAAPGETEKISEYLIEIKSLNPKLKDEQKSKTKPLTSISLKAFASLFPVSVVTAFIFVLYHNTEIAKGDLGLALQITSTQFPEQKITWATVILVYIAIFYISFLPAIILYRINQPEINHELHQYILIKNEDDSRIKLSTYHNYLVTQAAILTTASSFTIFYVLKITTHGNMTETLLFVNSLSMTACFIPIYYIIKESVIEDEHFSQNTTRNRSASILVSFILVVLVLIISWISPKVFLEYMPKNIGGIIANPGVTIETNEIDYACVFPSGETNPKSIAFGIIVSSDNSSVHLFTPSYNTETKRYAERQNNGVKKLNKLVESRIKYTNGFYIEKYDRNIHTYDENSGKCLYITPPPFYEIVNPKTKLVIRNIP